MKNINIKKIKLPIISNVNHIYNADNAFFSQESKDIDIVDQYKESTPTYAGHVRLLRWGNTSSAGMTVSFELLHVDENEQHPFKGLRAARATKTEGQRLNIVLSYPKDNILNPESNIYLGEALLLWWAEDCSEGMKLTLKLRDGPDGVSGVHPCDGMISGRKSGEILSLVSWAIDDQDLPEDSFKDIKKKRKFSEMSPTTQSHILCRDSRFYNWINANIDRFVDDDIIKNDISDIEDNEKFCEHVIKYFCNINSRADFKLDDDIGENARNKWSKIINLYEMERWN